ncbi:MAG: tetratricopeptide repeat protein [Thiotrichaceae bacterium]|nr:tetratricopeptide repeat protein [Thiotrichaceae bacterium]
MVQFRCFFEKNGNIAKARAAFRKQLEMEPNNENAGYNLSYILSKQGKIEEAIAAYRKYLEIKPEDAWKNLPTLLKRSLN